MVETASAILIRGRLLQKNDFFHHPWLKNIRILELCWCQVKIKIFFKSRNEKKDKKIFFSLVTGPITTLLYCSFGIVVRQCMHGAHSLPRVALQKGKHLKDGSRPLEVAGDTSPAWTPLTYGDCDASTEVTVTYLQQQPCATLLAEKSMLFIVMHKAFSHSLSCRVSASQHRWLKWACEISGIQWRLWELSAPPVDRRPAGENHTDVELFRNCSNNSPCPVKFVWSLSAATATTSKPSHLVRGLDETLATILRFHCTFTGVGHKYSLWRVFPVRNIKKALTQRAIGEAISDTKMQIFLRQIFSARTKRDLNMRIKFWRIKFGAPSFAPTEKQWSRLHPQVMMKNRSLWVDPILFLREVLQLINLSNNFCMASILVYSGHVHSAYCIAKNERPCCVRQVDV